MYCDNKYNAFIHSFIRSLIHSPFLQSRVYPAVTMPVHRDRDKKETMAEEMDVEDHEQDASTSEEEDSDTSSVSEEDGDSSGERGLLLPLYYRA